MKLSVGKRILMFFHWLLSLLIVAAFALYLIVPEFITRYYNMLIVAIGYNYVKIIGIALLAIYVILAVVQVCLIFKRGKRAERGFITVDSSDSGRVRIAISAIEQMVRQSVGNIDGITDMKISIENLDDAVGIGVIASIVNGRHVPTITMNMQRAIRQFVETNCGVAVRSVSINISAVTNEQSATRRRRGKGQEQAAPIVRPTDAYNFPEAPKPEAEPEPEPEPYQAPVIEPEPEPVVETPVFRPEPVAEAPAAEPQPAAEPAAEYDFDKPYESQFAKDLAAMKAREAAEAEQAETEAEDGYRYRDGE